MWNVKLPVIHKNTFFLISVTDNKYRFFISYLESLLDIPYIIISYGDFGIQKIT